MRSLLERAGKATSRVVTRPAVLVIAFVGTYPSVPMSIVQHRKCTASFWFAAVCLTISVQCASPRPPAADPGIEGYDEARLQALVRAGLPSLSLGACNSATLLGVLDEPSSGERLEKLVARAAASGVDANCVELLGAARLARNGRLDELDLEAELHHPLSVVRALALRYLVLIDDRRAGEAIVIALDDADRHVRIAAFRAAAARGRSDVLDAVHASQPVDVDEAFWRCTALARIDGRTTCDEHTMTMDVLVADAAPRLDRCAQAHHQLASTEHRDALWFFAQEAFRHYIERLDRLEAPDDQRSPCLLDRRIEEEILTDPQSDAADRAIVAASLLWRVHAPLGHVRETSLSPAEAAEYDGVQQCVNELDCTPGARCLRTSRSQRQGVCGTPRAARDRRADDQQALACWSFSDCPPFYSCYFVDRNVAHGVCLRP